MKRYISLFISILSLTYLSAKDIQNDVVLITGGTKGIGLDAAKHFAKEGCTVFATGRSVSLDLIVKYPDINFVYIDMANSSSIQKGLETITSKAPHIDILVNNAGYGLIGAEEAISIKEARDLFDVNFFGLVEMTQKVLPLMREKQKGHIINISSTSGIRALPGLGFYAASKFAVEGYSEALAFTVSPWNIHVTIVEPGTVKNNWGANCIKSSALDEIAEYKNLKNSLSKKICQLAKSVGQPTEEIANLLVKIAKSDNPEIRYQTSEAITEKLSSVHNDLTGRKNFTSFSEFFNALIKP